MVNQLNLIVTVEVTNRFKGLDLVDQVPKELWMDVRVLTKIIWKKKKCKTEKWLLEKAFQIGEKRRKLKGKGEQERYTQLNAEFWTIVRGERKSFYMNNAKK